MTNDLIRLAEAASLLGVSRVTLDRWHHSGKFPADVMTPGGERRWSRSRIMGTRLGAAAETAPPPRRTICYARVSTSSQKGDLIRQEETLAMFCAANGWPHETVSDVGSGMNYNKRGLRSLIAAIARGEVGRLVLTHKDRLLRFGAEIVFALCEERDVEVVVIDRTPGAEAGAEAELAADVLEIVTVFSARMYGARSRKNRKLMADLRAAAEEAAA